jgi:hypothetical protein
MAGQVIQSAGEFIRLRFSDDLDEQRRASVETATLEEVPRAVLEEL